MLRRADRTLLAFVAEGFFSRLSFGILTFVVPLFALQQGMSLATVGLFLSVNVIVSIALKPAMGALADRAGYKRSLTAAILLRSGVTLVFAFAATPAALFAARALHGVSIALRDPALGTLLAEHGGKEKVAQSFAWWQTAKSLAGNGSKIAGGLLLAATGGDFQLVFLAAFALSLVPLAVVLRHVHEAPAQLSAPAPTPAPTPAPAPGCRNGRRAPISAPSGAPAPRPAAVPGPEPEPRLERSAIASFAGLGLMVSLTAYMVGPMFPIIMVAYAGVSLDQAGLIYGLSGLVALSAPAFGWLADSVSNKLVLSLRSVANIGSSALYIAAPNLAGVAAGRVVDDLGKAAFKPAWGKLMADVSALDKRRRARLMGYMSSGEDAGEALGPILAGLLMSIWTIPVMLGARIVLAAVTELLTLRLTHRHLPRAPKGLAPWCAPRGLARWCAPGLPARALAALALGLGAGWGVHAATSGGPEAPRPAAAASARPGPAHEHHVAAGCTADPTVRAIRQAIGAC